MKHPIVAIIVMVLITCSAFFMPIQYVQAAEQAKASSDQSDKAKKKKRRRVKRAQTLRPKIFKKLDAARALADEKKYEEALESLKSLEKRKRNSYEKAMTHNMYAYVYFNKEDFPRAVQSYEKVIAVKNIPDSLRQGTLYSLAKLYLMQEQYEEALVPLDKWFALVEKPRAEAYILRAQIYFQLEQPEKSLPDVKAAIAQVKEQGKKPRENWLMLERAVYYQNKDFKSLARCLQDLAMLYPKGQYWIQLSAVYGELGEPLKELSALEAANEQGLLNKESELISFAQALMSQETPYKAAQVLSDGMKTGKIEANARNLSLLGDAWMLAKEYNDAIQVMAKTAKISRKGSDFYKLAQIHTERQEWSLALKNANAALADKQFKQAAQATILRGLVLFNMDNLDDAKSAFEIAKGFPNTEKMANQWLKFIESERRRREYMAANS